MSNPNLAMSADGGPDDLPRTLRRQREEREREALAREARERGAALAPAPAAYGAGDAGAPSWPDEPQPAIVTALQIPFFRLVLFFIKAVFAAIPALIILAALLWAGGVALKTYFPQLVHAEITIKIPR